MSPDDSVANTLADLVPHIRGVDHRHEELVLDVDVVLKISPFSHYMLIVIKGKMSFSGNSF